MTARIPRFLPGSLEPDQRELYDVIAGGRRAQGPQLFQLLDAEGALEGPFNGFLLQPRLGQALQALGSAVRYETSLTDRQREIAILVVADDWESAFEWYAHEAAGRHAGLTRAELAALRAHHYHSLPHPDRVVAQTTKLLVTAADLDDAEYRVAVDALGEPGLFELLTVVGYYATLALQLRVFRVPAPE